MVFHETLEPKDRETLDDPASVLGKTFGGVYEVRRYIGGGGFSWVYEGWDTDFGSPVAIKIMKSGDHFSNENFRREAKLAREFKHPNTVDVYRYGIDDGVPWLAMEYCPGRTLHDVMLAHRSRGEPVPDRIISLFVEEISKALETAHAQNLVHRDLKPHNIMFVREGLPGEHFKLMDFGISAKIDAATDATKRNVAADGAGTPEYMSPEQITAKRGDQSVTARSDIYSFGVILYQLLTGRVPHPVVDSSHLALGKCLQEIVSSAPTPPSQVTTRPISPEVEKVVLQCLAKSPAERPASMREVRQKFLQAFNPPPPPASTFWHRVLNAALITLAVVIALVAWWLRPLPSVSLVVPPPESIAAGDSKTIRVSVVGYRDPGPLQVQIDAQTVLPRGVRIRPLGTVSVEGGYFDLSVEVELNALLMQRVRVPLSLTPILAEGAKAKAAGGVLELVIDPPAVWLPAGFQRAEGAAILHVADRNYYTRIAAVVPGEEPVVFILIRENAPDYPSGLRTFYIMRDKVWIGLFERADFVSTLSEKPWRTDAAGRPITDLHLPVMNVTFDEAHRFAQWLAEPHRLPAQRTLGMLPSLRQWNAAAGFYEWKAGKLAGTDWTIGPFRQPPGTSEKPRVAVNQSAPSPVGTSPDDESFHGVRDLAGNGWELTRSGERGFQQGNQSAEAPYEFTPPILEDDSLFRRGQSYKLSEPVTFSSLEPTPTYVDYSGRHPMVGFRVVLEPWRDASP